VPPGSEAEPFVPEVNTRARARARWIYERVGRQDVVADWSLLTDLESGERWHLDDPRSAILPERDPARQAVQSRTMEAGARR